MHLLPPDKEGMRLMGDSRGNKRFLILGNRLDVLRFSAMFLLVWVFVVLFLL